MGIYFTELGFVETDAKELEAILAPNPWSPSPLFDMNVVQHVKLTGARINARISPYCVWLGFLNSNDISIGFKYL